MASQNFLLVLLLLDLLVYGQLNTSLHSLLTIPVELLLEVLSDRLLYDLEVPFNDLLDISLPFHELLVVVDDLVLGDSILVAELIENVPHDMVLLLGIRIVQM